MRDVALNLFWVNRFAMTMYDKQPTRWRDVPRTARRHVPADRRALDRRRGQGRRRRRQAYEQLPSTWNGESEDRIWSELFDVFGHRTFDATELPSIKPTIAEALQKPEA